MLFNLLYNLFTKLELRKVCYRNEEFDIKTRLPKKGAKGVIPIGSRCDPGFTSVWINVP